MVFSINRYELNEDLVSEADLQALKELNIVLKFDLVLNHLSVRSPQFLDMLTKGDHSRYRDFYIDWNKFWEGEGELNDEGYIIPNEAHLKQLFMRKPGLPILFVRFPDGSECSYVKCRQSVLVLGGGFHVEDSPKFLINDSTVGYMHGRRN
ncbi:MAG: hypothetical protein K1565_20260 [Candidatus Thiodiazotropha sp. (ex. Lucinisca nassula)]|nr:hypothetical protein [Candidatus Thiodiazotropha sp. (ex. Lucinisca nassula)]